jgi:hypothetical protein
MLCCLANLSSEGSSLPGRPFQETVPQQFRKINERRESKMARNMMQTTEIILRLGGRQNDIPFAFYMLGGW